MPERNLVDRARRITRPAPGRPGRTHRLRLACVRLAKREAAAMTAARTGAGDRRRGHRPWRGLSLKAQGGDVTLVEPNAIRRAYLKSCDCGMTSCATRGVAGAVRSHRRWRGLSPPRARGLRRGPARRRDRPYRSGRRGGLDIRRMTLQEITFIGTYTYTAQDFRDTAQAMFDGRLGRARLDRDAPCPTAQAPSATSARARRRAQDHSQTRCQP
jgi:hypothetical protein